MSSLDLENLTKRFARSGSAPAAVDGISLCIADGELIVVVGPSGCGKTTLLRLIAGLESPTAGVIRMDGRDIGRLPPYERNVAMVFQDFSLYPHMSVHQNMAFGLQMRKTPRAEIESRIQRAAAAMGLADLLPRKPGTLSGGQRQRAALAAALVREPACFLLDEPLSNLDASLRLHLRGELLRLHQRTRATMIHVTHDQEEALTLADRMVVMDGGRIRQAGTPREIHARPADRFTAAFIGSPPMNFIEGELQTPQRTSESRSSPGGSAVFTASGGRFRVRLAMPPSPASSAVLGVRPEHVTLLSGAGAAAETDAADAVIEGSNAVVDLIQWRGDSAIIQVLCEGGPPLQARAPADSALAPGDRVRIRIHTAHLHLFEPGPDGARLA